MSGKAYIVFTESDKGWLKKLLRPGFSHCWVAIPYGDRFIKIEKTSEGHQAEIITYNDVICNPVKIDVKYNQYSNPIGLLNTCVTLTKRFCGIKAPFVFTPFQLFKHCMRLKNVTK